MGIEFSGGSIEGGRSFERGYPMPDITTPIRRFEPRERPIGRPERTERLKRPEIPDKPESPEKREKPEKPIRSRRVELTAAFADHDGVRVQWIKPGPNAHKIVIDRSRGIQIGRHDRQLNHYRYDVVQPRVSLDQLLRGHPARQRALANLAKNPDSVIANFAFRHHLSNRAPYTRGRVRFAEKSGPRAIRVAARLNEQGAIEVKGSQGVQVTDGGTQRNQFTYRLTQPELSLEPLLRDRPDLVRALAVTFRDPENRAAQRSLMCRLENAYRRSAGSVEHLHAQRSGASGLFVTLSDGVQIGSDMVRRDRAEAQVRKMVLTGWGALGELERQRVDERAAERHLHTEQEHNRRSGTAERDISNVPRMIVPPLLRGMAATAVNEVAPGRRHMIGRFAETMSEALDTVSEFKRDDDLAIASGESFRVSPDANVHPGDNRDDAPRSPAVYVVDMPELAGIDNTNAARPGDHLMGWSSRPPWLSAAQPRAYRGGLGGARFGSSATATGATDSDSKVHDAGVPVGVVIWGSVRVIAAGGRILDAETLVRFARWIVFRETYDASPASAILAMRLVRALEVVVIIDPAINGGLWVDVNPATGEPAATLLIDGLPGGAAGTLRFFHA